jgi:hypothetical protein
MKWNSFIFNAVLATTMVVAYPSAGVSQSPAQNAEARRLYTEGRDLYFDGNFAEAERRFREALSRFPKAEQSDRTAYFLIDTLIKLRRVQDARVEIETFRRNYPKSNWQTDVDEKTVILGGLPNAPSTAIWNSPAELREAQARFDLLYGIITPTAPGSKPYADDFPANASYHAEILRQIIQRQPDRGIESAKELLKTNPSDPAVRDNLGTIANSDSSQALSFLLSVWTNPASSPNMRNTAFFWASRRNPDKEQVANAVMELLAKPETQAVASETLYRMTVADHRAVLQSIVNSSNPIKFSLMDTIYRNGSVLLRTDLLMFVARLEDPRAVPFIIEAAQNDKDASVRRAAVQALGSRKDVDVGMLEKLMRTTSNPASRQPIRAPGVPAAPVAPAVPRPKPLPSTSNP